MDAFCILFTDVYESNDNNLIELSKRRTLASIPFGGRYRLIDFMLSSLVGANIHNIGIITKSKYGSLMDHLGGGKSWDLDRKNGGIKILTPFATTDFSYNDNQFEILKNLHTYIDDIQSEYCVIANANMVANIDFNEIFNMHIKKDADITVLASMRVAYNTDTELTIDQNNKITNAIIRTNPSEDVVLVGEEIFVMKKALLYELVDFGATYGWRTFKKDVVSKRFSHLKIYAYEHKGYFKIIDNIDAYLESNLDMLKKEIRKEIFNPEQPILTRTKDSVPTKYEDNANVKNSYVADGCVIDGTVENSIIFRNVKVLKGAKIKNSVIMQGSLICNDVDLYCAVIDKSTVISQGKSLRGEMTQPVVVNKGKTV